jgi:hypothetical protein
VATNVFLGTASVGLESSEAPVDVWGASLVVVVTADCPCVSVAPTDAGFDAAAAVDEGGDDADEARKPSLTRSRHAPVTKPANTSQ